MENLIIVRHGEYHINCNDNPEHLTFIGKKQIKELAHKINNSCNGTYFFGFSNSPRAKESCEILENRLQGESIELKELYDENNDISLTKAKAIHEKVNMIRDNADNLILVTHYSVAIGYPKYFLQEEFSKQKFILGISKGQAIQIPLKYEGRELIYY